MIKKSGLIFFLFFGSLLVAGLYNYQYEYTGAYIWLGAMAVLSLSFVE